MLVQDETYRSAHEHLQKSVSGLVLALGQGLATAPVDSRQGVKGQLEYYRRLTRYVVMAFGLLAVFSSIFAAERVFLVRTRKGDEGWHSEGVHSSTFDAKLLSTLSTIICLLCLCVKAQLSTEIMKVSGQLLPQQQLWHTQLVRPLLLDLLLMGVHCPVGVYGHLTFSNFGVDITYDYDSLISALMLPVRLFCLARVLLEEPPGYQSKEARLISKLLSVRFDWNFGLRRVLDKYPITSVLIG